MPEPTKFENIYCLHVPCWNALSEAHLISFYTLLFTEVVLMHSCGCGLEPWPLLTVIYLHFRYLFCNIKCQSSLWSPIHPFFFTAFFNSSFCIYPCKENVFCHYYFFMAINSPFKLAFVLWCIVIVMQQVDLEIPASHNQPLSLPLAQGTLCFMSTCPCGKGLVLGEFTAVLSKLLCDMQKYRRRRGDDTYCFCCFFFLFFSINVSRYEKSILMSRRVYRKLRLSQDKITHFN